MDKTMQDRQPGLGTLSISGVLTLTKTGTTARTATFPDAAITVAGINYAQTWTDTQSFAAVSCTTLTASADATTRALIATGTWGALSTATTAAVVENNGGIVPRMLLITSTAGLNEKAWDFRAQAGVFSIRCANDALGGSTAALSIARSGQTPGLATFAAGVSCTTLASTVATGTAPFTVASTTVVANLNASFLGGATFAAPGAIGGTTPAAVSCTTLTATGTGGVGYATGAGGAVTQATGRTTGVTLNKTCGAITLVSAAGATAAFSFTVTNSTVAATDVVKACQKSGTDKYIVLVTAVGAGSFEITAYTTGGTTTEQPVFNFAVIKAVAA